MYIRVRYFAQLRELAAQSEEQIEISAQDTAQAIYDRLANRYGFPLAFGELRVAINDRFVEPTASPQHGDSLAFIPPVSGG